MGVVQEWQCPSCRQRWRLCLGHGMKHGSLGRVMKLFKEETQKQIAADAGGGALPLFSFQYQAAVCRQCQAIVAVPVLSWQESGQTYIGTCPKCNDEIELLEQDQTVLCPKCQDADLNQQDVGLWD